jgi:hypothetical protein
MNFWYISNIFQNTHVPYFIHEMHCFASVLMCCHSVITTETFSIGTFQNVFKNTDVPILNTWNALFCLCWHIFSLKKHFLLVHFIWYQNTHVPFFIYGIQFFVCLFLWIHCVSNKKIALKKLYIQMYTRVHMFHSIYMKWTVLLVLEN